MKFHQGRVLYIFFSLFILFSACKSSSEIRDGQLAYKLKKYSLASELLPKEFEKSKDPAEQARLALLIAESYRRTNHPEAAAHWYLKARDLGAESDAGLWYARSLQSAGHIDEAIAAYEEVIKNEPYRRPEIRKYIAAAEKAKKWMQEESYTDIINLKELNSVASDFGPAFYRDKRLLFTSNRESAVGEEHDQWTGHKYYDLFVTPDSREKSFGTPENFSSVLNGPFNDGPGVFNASYNEIYYTHCGSDLRDKSDYCGIWVSRRSAEGDWESPLPLPLLSDSSNIGQPALSPDGETLVFSAVAPSGFGGSDIYFSVRTIEGWSNPVNLGARFNTELDEAFPSFDEEGNLYFASNGIPGMGGFDIFKCVKNGKNKWVKPEQLPYPINSPADDFSILMEPLSEAEKETFYMKGYFSSSRPGGLGSDDLYYFERRKPPARYLLNITVMTAQYADTLNPKSEIIDTVPLPGAQIILYKTEPGHKRPVDTLKSDKNGEAEAHLEGQSDYEIFISAGPRYFNISKEISTKQFAGKAGASYLIQVPVLLDRIFREKEIVIPNIYYDFNDWHIRPDAAAVLDTTIYKLLVNNPGLVIELGSHTDSRGSDDYNLELSQKRAQAVVDYLVKKGIDRKRLIARGYGETQLVNRCGNGVDCTEEEHQENRRTTFRVLKSDFDKGGSK